jgi:hypothetical protein
MFRRIWNISANEVGNLYSKLRDDLPYRQEWAEKIGLGFQLVHNGPQNVVKVVEEKVAQTNERQDVGDGRGDRI